MINIYIQQFRLWLQEESPSTPSTYEDISSR